MYVRVTRLRHQGRRTASSTEPLEGELTVQARGASYVAELRAPMTMSGDPLVVLYDVRLIGIRDLRIFLRGCEDVGGAAVVQGWACEIVDVSAGLDAVGRPMRLR